MNVTFKSKVHKNKQPPIINENEFYDIKGYEGYYKINKKGEVISIARTIKRIDNRVINLSTKFITPIINNKGYYTIKLHKNSFIKLCMVHRLVAETFIPNPNNLPEVNHKDENKRNNSVDNLEWCTTQYNIAYSKPYLKGAEQCKIKVVVIDTLNNSRIVYNSIKELIDTYKISPNTFYNCSRLNRLYKNRYKFKKLNT